MLPDEHEYDSHKRHREETEADAHGGHEDEIRGTLGHERLRGSCNTLGPASCTIAATCVQEA
jgi:hypothetical protein